MLCPMMTNQSSMDSAMKGALAQETRYVEIIVPVSEFNIDVEWSIYKEKLEQ